MLLWSFHGFILYLPELLGILPWISARAGTCIAFVFFFLALTLVTSVFGGTEDNYFLKSVLHIYVYIYINPWNFMKYFKYRIRHSEWSTKIFLRNVSKQFKPVLCGL